jgi:hypothetical protein
VNSLAHVLCGPVVESLVNILIIHFFHDLAPESPMIKKKLFVNHIRILFDSSQSDRLRLSFGDYLCCLIDIFVDFFADYVENIVVDLT